MMIQKRVTRASYSKTPGQGRMRIKQSAGKLQRKEKELVPGNIQEGFMEIVDSSCYSLSYIDKCKKILRNKMIKIA